MRPSGATEMSWRVGPSPVPAAHAAVPVVAPHERRTVTPAIRVLRERSDGCRTRR